MKDECELNARVPGGTTYAASCERCVVDTVSLLAQAQLLYANTIRSFLSSAAQTSSVHGTPRCAVRKAQVTVKY